MAITLSTKNADPVFRSDSVKSLFENGIDFIDTTTTSTWNQGDFLCYDVSTNKIRPVAATTDAETILGKAVQAIIKGVEIGPFSSSIGNSRSTIWVCFFVYS